MFCLQFLFFLAIIKFISAFNLSRNKFNFLKFKKLNSNVDDFYDIDEQKYRNTYIIIYDEDEKIIKLKDEMEYFNLESIFFNKDMYSQEDLEIIYKDFILAKDQEYYKNEPLIFECNTNTLNFIGGVFEFYTYLYTYLLEDNKMNENIY